MSKFTRKSFIILFVLVVISPLVSFSLLQEPLLENLKQKVQEEFDWISYLEFYPELRRTVFGQDRDLAVRHYLEHGYSENRLFPSFYPPRSILDIAVNKLKEFTLTNQNRNVAIQNRTLVILHVGMVDKDSSVEVFINNLKILNYSIALDNENSQNFYWLNIFKGSQNNLNDFLPSNNQWNVVRMEWPTTPLEILTRMRTLQFLSENNTLTNHFGSVLFLNDGARGPMAFRENGEWVTQFRKLLFNGQDRIGIAGPLLSCEISPHLQSHTLIMRTEVVNPYVNSTSSFFRYRDWRKYNHRQDMFLFQLVHQELKWNVASFLHYHKLNKLFFDGECISLPPVVKNEKIYPAVKNPSRWCDLKPEEIIFYKFGGDIPHYVCEDVKNYMRVELNRLSEHEMKDSHLIVPETFQGGPAYDLYNQYELEIHRDFIPRQERKSNITLNHYDTSADKVCLLVRTAKMHEKQLPSEQETFPIETTATGNLEDIITCKPHDFLSIAFCCVFSLSFVSVISTALQRQTDPNWEAFFFLTDDQLFEEKLTNKLASYNDSRLSYVPVPAAHRPKVRRTFLYLICFLNISFSVYSARRSLYPHRFCPSADG
jgi:hypothetical protein